MIEACKALGRIVAEESMAIDEVLAAELRDAELEGNA